MKIVVTGTRGIPNIMGGVETHCEELFPRMVERGFDVTVIRRSNYVKDDLTEWKGVKLETIASPKKKSLEAIIHTFRAINKAKKMRADVVHINAIGPALLVPYAKLLGMKVVFTHHGPDYDRDKWGFAAKTMLKLGERMGCMFADDVIVISNVIKDLIARKYGRTKRVHLIYNGVSTPEICDYPEYFEELGIEPGKYILGMCRFVPEKNLHHLVEAFVKWKESLNTERTEHTETMRDVSLNHESNESDEWNEKNSKNTREACSLSTKVSYDDSASSACKQAYAATTDSSSMPLHGICMPHEQKHRFAQKHNLADGIPENATQTPTPNTPNIKLVLAGDTDFEDAYSLGLKEMARKNGVVLTGFIKGKKLHSLLTNCRCYCLPSSHEGLPIALLEAMSYGVKVIVSDIPANLEVGLPKDDYFHCGDVDELATKLGRVIASPLEHVDYDMTKYDWDKIADDVSEVYNSLKR
jgi:glycosyltransferase involved in cell wall biosynthesis